MILFISSQSAVNHSRKGLLGTHVSSKLQLATRGTKALKNHFSWCWLKLTNGCVNAILKMQLKSYCINIYWFCGTIKVSRSEERSEIDFVLFVYYVMIKGVNEVCKKLLHLFRIKKFLQINLMNNQQHFVASALFYFIVNTSLVKIYQQY